VNHNPGDSGQTNKDDLADNEKARNVHSREDSSSPSRNQKLRALLDGLDLTPDQTKDDQIKPVSRDSEILRDVPPHHGN
jgi:hypothetical protein